MHSMIWVSSLLLLVMVVPGQVQAQQKMKGYPMTDDDWDSWSNPGVLCPVELDDLIGIGTDKPNCELEVCCRNQSGGMRISWGDQYTWLYSDIGYTQAGGLVINSQSGGGWADIDLQSDGVSRLFVESAGNIGIGTTSPARNLEIDDSRAWLRLTSSSAQGSVLELKSSSTAAGTWRGRINFLDEADNVKAEIYHYDLEFFDDPGLYFVTNNSTRMMIHDDTGNVGIGCTNPEGSLWSDSKTLEIAGNAPSIVLDDGLGSAQDDFEISNGGGEVLFRDATDGIDIMMLGLTGAEEGRVGIMTTNPKGTLDVNGSIYQRGGLLHADYVFEEEYELESIEDHAKFMWQNKHLKAIPKASADENGLEIVEVGSHRRGIVEELEKAHIYIEQLHSQIATLKNQLENVSERLEELETDS
jgi:hypothetical protein